MIRKSERNTRPQVTGSILQCMDQVDDVREYLPDETPNLFFIRRLLTWLAPFQRDLPEEKPDIDVSQRVFVLDHSLFCVGTFSVLC